MAELSGLEAGESAHAQNVTEAELAKRYPGIERDVADARKWIKGEVILRLTAVPMWRFNEVATHLASTYSDFPNDRRRADKILAALRNGEVAWPLFVDEEDGFILEGRHRVVAFHQAGLRTADVVFVRPENAQVEASP